MNTELLPERTGMPPVMVDLGSSETVSVVAGTGENRMISLAELARLDPWNLALAEVTSPLPFLRELSLLVLSLDGTEQEVQAAIDWAGQRCDMAVLGVDPPEDRARHLWQRLPRALKDHGFLCLLNAHGTSHGWNAPLDHPFRAHFHNNPTDGEAFPVAPLREALLNHVARARREDLDGALLLLKRFGWKESSASTHDPASSTNSKQELDFFNILEPRTPSAGQDARVTPSEPTPEIISFLAAQADRLAELCIPAEQARSNQAISEVLELCNETIEACAEIAMPGDPELVDLLAEASDLAVLMQIEASENAMSDAVALMLQLRRDCEARLCA